MRKIAIVSTCFFLLMTGCSSLHQPFQNPFKAESSDKINGKKTASDSQIEADATSSLYTHLTDKGISDVSKDLDNHPVIGVPNEKKHAVTSKGKIVTDSDGEGTLRDLKGHDTDQTAERDKSPESIIDEALEFCDLSQELWQQGDLEKAIESLDHAYSLILKADDNFDPQFTQQVDDLRFTISKRILEIYASRNIVVNGKHNAIPISLNSHVKRELDRFTKGCEKDFFIGAYRRSGRYRSYIVEELKKAGLPEELSWMPLIESGFRVNALSPARALGLWQFIPSTGYKFGLKRDRYVDERLDPEKATIAAIAYLKELHKIFGDWATVLAAYNCGEGRVLKVIRSQNVNYLDNFWDLYTRLPNETARYVPRFLATLHIVNNLSEYGFNSIETDKPFEYETVEVSKRLHLKNIATTIGVSQEDLKRLNPELRYNIVPDENYPLNVPVAKKDELIAKIDQIPMTSIPKKPRFIRHRVRRGETLSTIARRYRTSARKIAIVNNLNKRALIVAGKTLKIPVSGSLKGTISHHHKKPKARIVCDGMLEHKVKRGDSLWIIARKYLTTTNKIQQINKLRTKRLQIGQILKVPSCSRETETAQNRTDEKEANNREAKTYRVRKGDVPFEIAKRYRMSLKRFLSINSLTKRSTIYPGQTLYVE